MRQVSKRAIAMRAALLVAAVLMCPSAASAGNYTVSGSCSLWQPYNNTPRYVAVFPSCPELVTRNVGFPSERALTTSEGGWVYYAPAGTTVASFALQGGLMGLNGWQAAVIPSAGIPVENCPGSTCPGASKGLGIQAWYPGYNSPAIYLRLRCGASGSCANNTTYGYAGITGSNITLTDWAAPGVAINGGAILSGWRRGTAAVTYDAGDNAGIKIVRGYLDGRPRAEVLRPCNYVVSVPCPNGGGSLDLDTTGLADGAHQMTVQVVDAGDNAASDNRTVYSDNTPPASPGSLSLEDGDGWRATNKFALRWSNPAQSASPIVAVGYVLCPTSNAAGNWKGCTNGSRNGSDIKTIRDLAVPSSGEWKAWIYLVDAAGNADLGTAATLPRLRFDPDPPSGSFLPFSADDPTRVRVAATDAISGVSSESLEIRRDGTDTWTEIPVTPDASGFSAALDDGALPQGVYHLRARIVDAAGNDRTIENFDGGQPAALGLPIRLKTRLAVGRVKHVLARSSRHGKKRYRRVLVDKPRSRYGRTVRLSGRLTTPGANPVAGMPVEVWEQVELPGSQWAQIATVQTSRTGRFTFKALRGPSRLLQFRYHGTGTIRSRISTVDLRVKATSSLRVNRHHVNNGDFVSFHGRLKGRPIPPGGKLVELQVFTRGQWRTFAQARANSASGLWGYRYRFEAINGRVRFRFRARVRKEATYPYDLGTSRQVRVTVRGG